jgi:hypothetical protein
MQEQPATAASNVAKLAKRRPDWELPELHLDLKLSSHDPLQQSIGHRITCPRWYAAMEGIAITRSSSWMLVAPDTLVPLAATSPGRCTATIA